ncbi:zf-CCCH domain-containing protein/RRM_6 domain-containing protein [Cephalotus follicularis]|uniref:Zf-CCCH domain-containing protein/RRM_6 domain-containing protein n=1 Tax=Cephalotus follicularis TaxID=3775 RepID=A0A1Q3BAK9_CEPFO|nr:zf-CCCH domain-containing protein/RRM_6 domain-containing protein [Cephalotus follicularis]
MDAYEATKVVFSRIQSLDPENASKIMGYLLIQDCGEKEMIRLAFGPETLIHSLIFKAKTHLGLPSNPPLTPCLSPISRPNPLSISSSRLSNSGSFDFTNPSSPSTPWFSSNSITPSSNSSSLSFANVVNGTCNSSPDQSLSSFVSLSASARPYYDSNGDNSSDFIDDYQLLDHLSFLNESKTEDMFDPRLELATSPSGYSDAHLHKMSFSVPGMCFGGEDANSGFGWKPCLYFARGFCKNGSSCRFLHGDNVDGASIVGSPSKLNEFEHSQELLRSKAAQQQKLASASQFMAEAASFPYNKCMNFLLQQQNDSPRSAAAALMMGDELHKFGRCRTERNDFSAMGLGGVMNPGSRQIYLTFPADSTFREEDVSNYFSIYGPVQDVRIPYQQKRMFGFVTFVYPETVKLILAKGNPHFVCDSRVLVKPYKEKGKVPDKKQQQMERGDYSACSSPSRLDSREPFDLHLGARMFYNTQEMLLRRKLEEQADLQQAIELQGRRLMNLQLLDLKNHHHHHHQYNHGLSTTGSPIPSPDTPNGHTLIFQADGIDQEVHAENSGSPVATVSQIATADADQQMPCNHNNVNGNNTEQNDLHESLEHILPDTLFASPKKSAGGQLTVFSVASAEADDSAITATTSSCNNNNTLDPSNNNTLNMASFKSCFLQLPRLSSGHGACSWQR